jgi:hypothetical protein
VSKVVEPDRAEHRFGRSVDEPLAELRRVKNGAAYGMAEDQILICLTRRIPVVPFKFAGKSKGLTSEVVHNLLTEIG